MDPSTGLIDRPPLVVSDLSVLLLSWGCPDWGMTDVELSGQLHPSREVEDLAAASWSRGSFLAVDSAVDH